MQPYTPHGDSNYHSALPKFILETMQPYTPHGDSNALWPPAMLRNCQMQPYTPHGDSDLCFHPTPLQHFRRCNLIPLALSRFLRRTCKVLAKSRSAAPAVPSLFRPLDALGAAAPHGDSNLKYIWFLRSIFIMMQPYTPHGDSNTLSCNNTVRCPRMQPYSSCALPIFAAHLQGACKTRSAAPAVPSLFRPLDALAAAAPHGDSNETLNAISNSAEDATLYPSRGQ